MKIRKQHGATKIPKFDPLALAINWRLIGGMSRADACVADGRDAELPESWASAGVGIDTL